MSLHIGPDAPGRGQQEKPAPDTAGHEPVSWVAWPDTGSCGVWTPYHFSYFQKFYAQIPDSLMESAFLDVAGFFSTCLRIIFPLSIPGFVVTSLWQFTQVWNEFLWGICLTRHTANPITVGLSQLAGSQEVSWNFPMAGSILAALPVLMIYILLGRYFIRRLLAGSVKK